MMMKKIVAAAVLTGCLSATMSGFAHEPGAYSKEALRRGHDKTVVVTEAPLIPIGDVVGNPVYQGKKIAVRGSQMFFVEKNVYKMSAEDGALLRVDLGKYGGKLLGRTPFVAIGEMKTDETGEFFAAEKVIWVDFNPYEDYFNALNGKSPKDAAGGIHVINDRDPAYFHAPIESENKRYLLDNPAKLSEQDLANYRKADAADVSGGRLAVGTKVALMGRNVATIAGDIMKFWDLRMQEVPVHMNGAYSPLGQRGTFYGTIQKDASGYYLSLDCMESIE